MPFETKEDDQPAKLDAKAAKASELEARFIDLQLVALTALGDAAGKGDAAVYAELLKIEDEADKARIRPLATRVREFGIAFSQYAISRDVVGLKAILKSSLKANASFKVAAEIIVKTLEDLIVPKLNRVLGAIYDGLTKLSDAMKKAADADLLDADLKKRQEELAAALKKIKEALKKIEDDAKKKKEEAEKAEKDKKGGA